MFLKMINVNSKNLISDLIVLWVVTPDAKSEAVISIHNHYK